MALGRGTTKITFCSLLLLGCPSTPPPKQSRMWESDILGPYFDFVMDAIDLETQFTLETKRKK